jgi:hypothetical protein
MLRQTPNGYQSRATARKLAQCRGTVLALAGLALVVGMT